MRTQELRAICATIWQAIRRFASSTRTFANYFPNADIRTEGIFEFNASKKNPYPKADVLTGGYPCQSFSMGGVRNPSKDDRSNLFLGFAEAVNKVRPKVFIAENVSGLAKLQNGEWFRRQIHVYENELSERYPGGRLRVDVATIRDLVARRGRGLILDEPATVLLTAGSRRILCLD